MIKLRVPPVVFASLLQHHPVSRSRVEDLLEHDISNIGYKSNHREYYNSHVSFGRDTGIPNLSSNLRLKDEGHIRGIQDHSGDIIQTQAEQTGGKRNPIPMHSFNVNLDTDSVDNDCEGYTTAEPMGLTLAIVVSGSF